MSTESDGDSSGPEPKPDWETMCKTLMAREAARQAKEEARKAKRRANAQKNRKKQSGGAPSKPTVASLYQNHKDDVIAFKRGTNTMLHMLRKAIKQMLVVKGLKKGLPDRLLDSARMKSTKKIEAAKKLAAKLDDCIQQNGGLQLWVETFNDIERQSPEHAEDEEMIDAQKYCAFTANVRVHKSQVDPETNFVIGCAPPTNQ
tara:strand:+ start:403 stop:1008 length:606 start_codon:yes stop_codon:yes gene_type:complete